MILVRVPATTANLGPGFDCFGMALALYGTLRFEEREEGLAFSGVEERYRNEDNLAVRAYRRAQREMGVPETGLYVDIQSDIPVSRGLGSSASLIAAGIAAASAAHGHALDDTAMLRLATELEGHPDNVAPALLGGLTVSMQEEGQVYAMRCPISENVRVCVLIPDFELSTHRARAALPREVPLADAVYNASHAALLLRALEQGDMTAISAAMRDRLHQPYRKGLIAGYDAARTLALRNGAAAFAISGAGPTLVCLHDRTDFAARMREDIKALDGIWRVLELVIDTQGAVVSEVAAHEG